MVSKLAERRLIRYFGGIVSPPCTPVSSSSLPLATIRQLERVRHSWIGIDEELQYRRRLHEIGHAARRVETENGGFVLHPLRPVNHV